MIRQGDGDVEVPPARLHDRRRRQDPGVALDVAADHDRGAHLRDDAAEAGHHGRQERQARLLDQDPDHLDARGAQGEDLEAEVRRQVLDGRQGDPRDDGGGDDGLGQDDGRRGVEDLQKAERPVPPEEDRHEEADDDRREAHPRVDQAHDELPPGKPGEGHGRPDGDPDEEADQRRQSPTP